MAAPLMDSSFPLLRTDIPQSARIWNYWMGGKDYCEIDRVVGDRCIQDYPAITTIAEESGLFRRRVVDYLAAEAKVGQFIEIGCGLPNLSNTHDLAQRVIADARIIYADNDPLVLTHARALMTSNTAEGVVACIDADFHYPEPIISDASRVLDFDEPIAILALGVFGYARSYDDVRRVVSVLDAAAPSGSFLALWDGTSDDDGYCRMYETYLRSGATPYTPRTREQLLALLDGMEMIAPGLVPLFSWRPTEAQTDSVQPLPAYGALARKP
ncbi:SAM-dependent methyltransferase [Nocardia goodfellowii]